MNRIVLLVGVAGACAAVASLDGCSSSSSGGGSGSSVDSGAGSGSGGGSGGSSGSSSGGGSGGSSGSSSGGATDAGSGSGSGSGSGGGSGSSSGGSSDGGCATPTAAVANSCTDLVGACLVSNPSAGQISCSDFWGQQWQAAAAAECTGGHTWMAGSSCSQLLGSQINVGCATNSGAGSCQINYYPCLSTCFTCTNESATCVIP